MESESSSFGDRIPSPALDDDGGEPAVHVFASSTIGTSGIID